MVTARQILSLADEIAKKFSPQKIILFGSYAYGTPTLDSDVDLMVVTNYRGPSYRKEAQIRLALDRSISIDVHVRSPTEIDKRIAIDDFFFMDILEQGMVLYDAHDRGVGEKGRRRLRRHLSRPTLEKV